VKKKVRSMERAKFLSPSFLSCLLIPYLLINNFAVEVIALPVDNLKKDHTRFIISPGVNSLGSFSIQIKIENELDPEKARNLHDMLSEALDESFTRLLLQNHLAPVEKADAVLSVRLVGSAKAFKYSGLRCVSYAYVRLFIDLMDKKTNSPLLTGVSEGCESNSDSGFWDQSLRKKLLKQAFEQAAEKVAVKLKGIEQGQASQPDLAKPTYIEKRLAILPFSDTSPEAKKEGLAELVSNMMSTAIGPERAFIVVERVQVGKVIDELNFSQSGYVGDEQAKNVGKLLGADYLLVGSINSKEDAIEVDARIIEVETGQVIVTAGERVKGVSSLRTAVCQVASRLIQEYSKRYARRW